MAYDRFRFTFVLSDFHDTLHAFYYIFRNEKNQIRRPESESPNVTFVLSDFHNSIYWQFGGHHPLLLRFSVNSSFYEKIHSSAIAKNVDKPKLLKTLKNLEISWKSIGYPLWLPVGRTYKWKHKGNLEIAHISYQSVNDKIIIFPRFIEKNINFRVQKSIGSIIVNYILVSAMISWLS